MRVFLHELGKQHRRVRSCDEQVGSAKQWRGSLGFAHSRLSSRQEEGGLFRLRPSLQAQEVEMQEEG